MSLIILLTCLLEYSVDIIRRSNMLINSGSKGLSQ